MELKIEISDQQFEDVIKNNLSAITNEQLSLVITKGIEEYLQSDKGIKLIEDYFLIESNNSGYYGYQKKELNNNMKTLLSQLLKETSLNDDIKKIGDKMCSLLNENYKDILIATLSNILISSINRDLWGNIDFNTNLQMTINQCINNTLNNNNNN